MEMRMVTLPSLIMGVALCLLALSIYWQAARVDDRVRLVAAGLYAYSGVSLLVFFIFFFARPNNPPGSPGDSWLLYMILNGLRPYAFLAASLCLLYAARRDLRSPPPAGS